MILDQLLDEPVTPWQAFGISVVYGALGDTGEACEWLTRRPAHAFVPWCRVDDRFARLAFDPQFNQLLAQMNLPPVNRTVAAID